MTTISQEHPPEIIEIDLPAALKYLNVVASALEAVLSRFDDVQIPAETIYHVQLAVHEICTNVVLHAYNEQHGQRIHVKIGLAAQKRQIQIVVFDTGLAFDQQATIPPDLKQPRVHGYGLYLIHELMDSVQYKSLPGGNQWSLVKNL
jgi:serine/threonine-protein kinase RsbW